MSQVVLEVVKSRKGHPMITKDGFLFNFHKDGLNKKMWACDKRYTKKCTARMHTTENFNSPRLICQLGSHNHGPDAIECDVKRVMSNIRKEAGTSTASPAQIIANNVRTVSAATQGQLPLIQNVKRGIRRVRAAALGPLVIP